VHGYVPVPGPVDLLSPHDMAASFVLVYTETQTISSSKQYETMCRMYRTKELRDMRRKSKKKEGKSCCRWSLCTNKFIRTLVAKFVAFLSCCNLERMVLRGEAWTQNLHAQQCHKLHLSPEPHQWLWHYQTWQYCPATSVRPLPFNSSRNQNLFVRQRLSSLELMLPSDHLYSQSHVGWYFRRQLQSSKLKARTSLFTETWHKRLSSFKLWVLKQLSKMSPQVG